MEKIKESIAVYKAKIEIETSLNHHNLKLYGENFFKDILNIIDESSNFNNANILDANFPAIDLVCDTTKRCIQITSNRTRDKIKHTFEKFKKLSKYSDYSIEIYYLLEAAKPNNISDLESELSVSDLSSKLKDFSDLIVLLDDLDSFKIEKIYKLFTISNDFIDLYQEVITAIEEDIRSLDDIRIETKLNTSLNTVKNHFKCHLDVLQSILEQIDCKLKRNMHDKYASMYKFMSFLVLANEFKTITMPSINDEKLIVDAYLAWMFSVSRNETSLEFHIGEIARYLSNGNSQKIIEGTCFLTSLLDNGGLNCKTCIDGVLGNITNKINEVVTDFTDHESQNILKDHFDFMDIKQGQKLEFKCGQCISNISRHENAKKII